ncbi:MAG: hypothetical protein P4L72_12185 [Parvibaculum sp.]|jgi:hypothetical protein|uniref:hypothetical protein n=1 Tax=Parvibaculum sp. TaxID=2024848 RepID=UPI00284129B7|nr:hypothetical protein [Parvibaculum sp.]MDR3499971.1 hypothetical protein [Parvibaculum sp.]
MALQEQKTALSQRMMNMAVVMLATVGVIAYFIYTGNVQPDEPVKLVVTTEQGAVAADGQIPFGLTVRLENNTKDGLVLTAPTQCDVFRWFITNTNKEFVQSQATGMCAQVVVTNYLEGNHAMTEKYTLELDPARVKPGEYLLFVRYWGHELTQPLTIK